LGKNVEDGNRSGGEKEGEAGGGGGEMVLWENIWDSLDLENEPMSEEKLRKKVQDGKESEGEE
jgi:hypothetical protein